MRIKAQYIIPKLKAEGCQSLSLDEVWRCLKGCVMPYALMVSAIEAIETKEITEKDIMGQG